MALVVKGDHRWFAWDDAYGGWPLFISGTSHLPDAITAARVAFPRQSVDLAWWTDEGSGGNRSGASGIGTMQKR